MSVFAQFLTFAVYSHPVNLQVVERKALGHLSFAWEFCVAIHFLSSGILQHGATYNWRGRNGRSGHLNRASPTNI
jgi:hypothetical protein